MVGQHSGGEEEEEWEKVSVYGFHRSKQSLPKDPFSIPRIDQLVDVMVGHP